MTQVEITGLVFLFLGSLFTFSLIRSFVKLSGHIWNEDESLGIALLKIFNIPLISLILLLIYVFTFVK